MFALHLNRSVARIVALAVLAASTPGAFAQSPQAPVSADMVIQGGKIVTLDSRSSIVQAVAVRGGRFLAVGSDAEVKGLIGPNTRVIDLGGRTAVPGLNDTHTHFHLAGLATYTVNLGGAKSVAEALDAIRAFAATKKPGEWIQSSGWHPPSQLAEKRYLTRQEIDRAAPNNPAYLITVGHFAMANSVALKLAGIARETPNPQGGTIVRDEATGEPTGVLIGQSAQSMVTKVIPPWTLEQRVDQAVKAMRLVNSFGLTSTVHGALDPEQVRLFQHLADAGQLTLRVGIMLRPESPPGGLKEWEGLLKATGARSGFGNEWLRFAGVKATFDGGMTLRTAHTRRPYPDDENYFGMTYMSYDGLRDFVALCNRHGWRVGVHTVGDKAVDLALDAFENADKESPIVAKRFVLIHASLIQRDQMERAKRLGVRLDVQNIFMWDKAATVARFLGKDVADRAVPTRTMIDVMGIENVGAGTDFPVNTLNPFLNMYVMITRKDPNGTVYGAGEAISREEALRLYTTSAAHYTFEESIKGSVEPGKLADLTVLSDDLLTVPEEAVKDLRATMTIVGGRIVYQR